MCTGKILFYAILISVLSTNLNFAQELNDSIIKVDSLTNILDNESKNSEALLQGFSVNTNDINYVNATLPLQFLRGKIPGFAVNYLNINDPNPDLQVQLRGISTLFLKNNPLYIVNGVPVEDPEVILTGNIKSIKVLRNLSETAIYGIRGVDGVILIETDTKYSNPINISFHSYSYFEKYTGDQRYLSATEWRKLKNDWSSSSYDLLRQTSEQMIDYNDNTNWRNKISQDKISFGNDMEVSGTLKKTTYNAFFGYKKHHGILKKSDNNEFSGRFSATHLAINDKLEIHFSVNGLNRNFSKINSNPFIRNNPYPDNSNILTYAGVFNPTVPLSMNLTEIGRILYNPSEWLENIQDERTVKNLNTLVKVKYDVTKALSLSASFSRDRIEKSDFYSLFRLQTDEDSNQQRTRIDDDKLEKFYRIKLEYNKTIAQHQMNSSLSYSNQMNKLNSTYSDSIFENGSPLDYSLHETESKIDIQNINASFNYNFNNKYYLFYGISRETSSLYTLLDKSTFYYNSISGNWSVKKEDFLKNAHWLDELNIKAGYGNSRRRLLPNNIPTNGSIYFWNLDIHGEKVNEANAGIALSMLSKRLRLSVTTYKNITKEGIVYEEIPDILSGPNSLSNEAKITNKGCEFLVKTNPVNGTFKWYLDFNLSINKNSIQSDIFYEYKSDISKNQPIGNFYGYEFLGYTESDEVLVKDYYGDTLLYRWEQGEYKKIGNGAPTTFFTITNEFAYKNFDLSILMRGAAGFDIKNMNEFYLGNSNYKKSVLTTDPRRLLTISNMKDINNIITRGDYFRIDNVTLGYTILHDRKWFKKSRLYISCNNVMLFSKFKHGDPETSEINGVDPGLYFDDIYPETRLYLIGLKINLE